MAQPTPPVTDGESAAEDFEIGTIGTNMWYRILQTQSLKLVTDRLSQNPSSEGLRRCLMEVNEVYRVQRASPTALTQDEAFARIAEAISGK